MANITTMGSSAPVTGTGASKSVVIEVVRVPEGKALDPHWTAYVQAVGTPLVAVIAAVIAATIQYRQWRTATAAADTAKNKLKLDLFERRFAVFNAAAQLITTMHEEHVHNDNDVVQMLSKLAGSEFLFDDKVNTYIVDEIFKGVQKKMSLQGKMIVASQSENQELFERLSIEHEEVQEWFDNQLEVLKQLMRPFLQLTH